LGSPDVHQSVPAAGVIQRRIRGHAVEDDQSVSEEVVAEPGRRLNMVDRHRHLPGGSERPGQMEPRDPGGGAGELGGPVDYRARIDFRSQSTFEAPLQVKIRSFV
jgi:hypothetical protein